MKLYYILDANRQKVGPYAEQDLAAAYYRGIYGSSTLAWCQGMKEWSPLNAIFEEMPPVPAPAVPPPPPAQDVPTPPPAQDVSTPPPAQAPPPPGGATKPAFSMNPIFVLKHAYTHITFEGRATRKEFWSCILWFSILNKIITDVLNEMSEWAVRTHNTLLLVIIFVISLIVAVAELVPLIAVTGRRLHDLGWSACLALYTVIPAVFLWLAVLANSRGLLVFAGISLIFLLVLMLLLIKDSQRGTNEYGPSEKYPDNHHAR